MKSAAEEFVSFCPNCGSVRIFLDTEFKAPVGYREFYFRCKDCGLFAKIFPEVRSKDLKTVQAELKAGLSALRKKSQRKTPAKKRSAKRKSVKRNG